MGSWGLGVVLALLAVSIVGLTVGSRHRVPGRGLPTSDLSPMEFVHARLSVPATVIIGGLALLAAVTFAFPAVLPLRVVALIGAPIVGLMVLTAYAFMIAHLVWIVRVRHLRRRLDLPAAPGLLVSSALGVGIAVAVLAVVLGLGLLLRLLLGPGITLPVVAAGAGTAIWLVMVLHRRATTWVATRHGRRR